MCFSNGDLGAASLWRDRPGFGRFDKHCEKRQNFAKRQGFA
jgi:hypothetical protein